MSGRTGQDRRKLIGKAGKKRAREDDSAGMARYNFAASRHASAPFAMQRTRIVAEQLYDWCAQRDDSGHVQLIDDTVRSNSYVVCEMDATCTYGARIVLCSAAFSLLTGYSQAETIGRPFSMLHGSKTSQESASHAESIMMQGTSTTIQLTSYTRSGQPFWNMVHIIPVPLETTTGGKLSFVSLTNVSDHLLCGGVGQFPMGLDFLSEDSSELQIPRMLLGTSLVCRAEHEELTSTFVGCEYTRNLSFCIVNPALDFCPISFASDAFLELNGCDAQAILGHSCCLAGGLPTSKESLDTFLRAWDKDKLPLATRMLCFCKGRSDPVHHDVQIAPLLTQKGDMARIVVVTHPAPRQTPGQESMTSDINPQASPAPEPFRHVMMRLAEAEAIEGSRVQFFLRLQHAHAARSQAK